MTITQTPLSEALSGVDTLPEQFSRSSLPPGQPVEIKAEIGVQPTAELQSVFAANNSDDFLVWAVYLQ